MVRTCACTCQDTVTGTEVEVVCLTARCGGRRLEAFQANVREAESKVSLVVR